jgi:hypothetical protein
MKAEDVTDTLELALKASGCDQAKVVHKPRLLSDNGSSHISGSPSCIAVGLDCLVQESQPDMPAPWARLVTTACSTALLWTVDCGLKPGKRPPPYVVAVDDPAY